MKLVLLLVASFLVSCTASVQVRKTASDLRLRDYNNVSLNLLSRGGSILLSSATLSSLGPSSASRAELGSIPQQDHLAFESLKFELMGIGFNLIAGEKKAAAIVDFFIGTIRYDPFVGWIADQAFVKFRDSKTGRILAFFRADTTFITPTVNNIISELATAIGEVY